MNIDSNIGTTDKAIQYLEATKKDIEQFLYDLSLETTDAESRYEKLKEELKASINEIKESLESNHLITEEVAVALRAKLSTISEHLNGSDKNKVEYIKHFVKSIKSTLKEVANVLSKDSSFNDHLERIYDRLQRYKLKFEIIKLKLVLGNLKAKYVGERMRHLLIQKIDALSSFIHQSQDGAEEKLRTFRHTMKKIYADIEKIL